MSEVRTDEPPSFLLDYVWLNIQCKDEEHRHSFPLRGCLDDMRVNSIVELFDILIEVVSQLGGEVYVRTDTELIIRKGEETLGAWSITDMPLYVIPK